MLRDATIVAQLGTADMRAARAFYVDRLGLPLMMDPDEIIVCQATDRSALIVYSRPGHRAPDNTVASFLVSDLEAEVAELRGIGVSFEESFAEELHDEPVGRCERDAHPPGQSGDRHRRSVRVEGVQDRHEPGQQGVAGAGIRHGPTVCAPPVRGRVAWC